MFQHAGSCGPPKMEGEGLLGSKQGHSRHFTELVNAPSDCRCAGGASFVEVKLSQRRLVLKRILASSSRKEWKLTDRNSNNFIQNTDVFTARKQCNYFNIHNGFSCAKTNIHRIIFFIAAYCLTITLLNVIWIQKLSELPKLVERSAFPKFHVGTQTYELGCFRKRRSFAIKGTFVVSCDTLVPMFVFFYFWGKTGNKRAENGLKTHSDENCVFSGDYI